MIVYENEDIIRAVKTDMSVIPAHTLTFSENALYVAESVERDFNEMFETIGVNELAVFESTGMQIVYEGKSLKDLKDTVIEFFKKLWGKIKAFFEDVIAKFNSLSKEVKKRLPDIGSKDLDKLPDDKKFGRTHNFGKSRATSYGINAKDFAEEVSNKFEKLSKESELDSQKVAELANELEEQICSKISGIDGVKTSKEMLDSMTKTLLGDEIEADKKFVKDNFSTIKGIVMNGLTIDVVKKKYKESRQFIDECIKTAKGYTDERAKVASSEIKVLKSIGQCMNQANAKGIDICKRRYNEYRNILVRVAVALGKVDSVKESTTSYSAQLDLIEAAFDF